MLTNISYDDNITNEDAPDSFEVEGIVMKWDPDEDAWLYDGGWFQVCITHHEPFYEPNVWVMGCRVWLGEPSQSFVGARNALVEMSRELMLSMGTGLPFLDWSRQQVSWGGA